MKKLKGAGNGVRKMRSVRRNMNTLPWYLREHKAQQDSIPKTGMSFNKKQMNGRLQINSRGFHRWCFVADVWRYILGRLDISQSPALNT